MKFTPAGLRYAPLQPAPRQSFNFKVFACGSLIVLSCLWSACSGGKDAKAADAARKQRGSMAIPVTVATAKDQDMPVYLNGLGSVTAFNTVSVKSRIDGQLTQVAFKEGQHVNKGDLLAVIDPRPYEVALEPGAGSFVPRSGATDAMPSSMPSASKTCCRIQERCRSSKWIRSKPPPTSWKEPSAPTKRPSTTPSYN